MDSSHPGWKLREQLPAVLTLLLALAAFSWLPGGFIGDVSGLPAGPGDSGSNQVVTPRITPDQALVEIFGDFRVSETGADSDPRRDAFNAAVAYNSTNGEYLVVWQADDPGAGLGGDDFQIIGQRIDALTSLEIGGQFLISDLVVGDREFGAFRPAVAYNSIDNEYLVVWEGDDDIGPLVEGESEIFGQRLDADPGSFGEIGDNDFRISTMGVDGNRDFGAFRPSVAYNATDNEYLVVWEGDDDTRSLVEGESEIFGQRLDADPGSFGEIGADDFRISSMGVDGNREFGAFHPAVTYNHADNEYLVVWDGDDDTPPLVEGESEIFGQRLDADPGSFGEIGADDFRISDMGPDGNRDFGAFFPVLAFNSTEVEFLVAWEGDDDSSALVEDELEIFGQRLDAAGGEQRGDFRISQMGPDGDPGFDAFRPAVTYNSNDNEYLVVWQGDDELVPLTHKNDPPAAAELEIHGQRLDAAGVEIGDDDFRISDMGLSDGDPDFDAFEPAVIHNPDLERSLVAWHGDDDTGALVDEELEVYAQLLGIVADLAVDKQAASPTAIPGQTLSYSIEASNLGPSDVTSASVTDLFPATLSCTWTCAPNGAGASCTAGPVAGNVADLVDLPIATSVVYSVTCSIDSGATGFLLNTATVTPPLGAVDPEPDNDESTAVVELLPTADLEIDKQAAAPTAVPGEMLSYAITVSNIGPSDVTAAGVSDLFPTPLACTWTCAPVGIGASCTSGPVAGDINDLVNLPVATSAVYTADCTIAPGTTGVLFNEASVTAPIGVSDPDPFNNESTAGVEMVPTADLAVTKTDGLTEAHPGDVVTYTIEVLSAGPSDAPGTMLVDPFPASLEAVEWACAASAGSTCPAMGTGDLDEVVDVLVGGTVTFTVTGTIVTDFLGDLVNTAMAATAAGVTDPNVDDNAATDVTTVTSPAEVVASKSVSGDFMVDGSIVYEILLINVSPYEQFDDPDSDEFVDILPSELELVDATADSGVVDLDVDAGVVTWNGSIPAGGEVAIAIEATIAYGFEGAVIVNQAEVFYDADGDGVNDTVVLTDDPGIGGDSDPTEFMVANLIEIPTLSSAGFLLLAGFLAAVAMVSIRRRKRLLD